MVNYEEFKENFKEDVTRELAKKGIEDVEINIQPNEKLNQSYDALTVRPEGTTLGVSLNFTKIADEYENRGNYDSLVDAVAKRIDGRESDIIDKETIVKNVLNSQGCTAYSPIQLSPIGSNKDAAKKVGQKIAEKAKAEEHNAVTENKAENKLESKPENKPVNKPVNKLIKMYVGKYILGKYIPEKYIP